MATPHRKGREALISRESFEKGEGASLPSSGVDYWSRYQRAVDREGRKLYPVRSKIKLLVGGSRGVRYRAQVVDGEIVGASKRYERNGVSVRFIVSTPKGDKTVTAWYGYDEVHGRVMEAAEGAVNSEKIKAGK